MTPDEVIDTTFTVATETTTTTAAITPPPPRPAKPKKAMTAIPPSKRPIAHAPAQTADTDQNEQLRADILALLKANAGPRKIDQAAEILTKEQRTAMYGTLASDAAMHAPSPVSIDPDAYTDPQPPALNTLPGSPTTAPKPTPAEANKQFWKMVFANDPDRATFADYEQQRIVVAWRLLREMARRRKEIYPEQSLPEGISLNANKNNPDPWVYPAKLTGAAKAGGRFPFISGVFFDIIREAETLPQEECAYDKQNQLPRPGISYLPPPVAPKYYTSPMPPMKINDNPEPTRPQASPIQVMLPPCNAIEALATLAGQRPYTPPPETLRDDYDPSRDRQLGLYCSVLRQIARDLQIEQGSELEPDYGNHGIKGLLEPRTCRLVFPARTQICTFELLLTERCCNTIVQKNLQEARKALRYEWGLTSVEIEQVVGMARRFAVSLIDSNTVGNRAMIALRLEDYIQRSKTALDLNNEIKGLKLLSIIQEVAKTSDITNVTQDIDIKVLAQKVSKFDFGSLRAALVSPSSPPQLNAGETK